MTFSKNNLENYSQEEEYSDNPDFNSYDDTDPFVDNEIEELILKSISFWSHNS